MSASTHSLTDEERSQLATLGLYLVNLHDDEGWPGAFRSTVAYCLTREEATQEVARLSQENPETDYRVPAPRYLLELHDGGELSAEKIRELLAKVRDGSPHHLLPPLLTNEEKGQAIKVTVYYLWYEDRFHFGGDRDSYPVSICLSKEEAEETCRKTGRPVQTGADGYFVVGPNNLADERRPHLVRKVLQKIAENLPGPIPMNES